jgi:hypothetical protein
VTACWYVLKISGAHASPLRTTDTALIDSFIISRSSQTSAAATDGPARGFPSWVALAPMGSLVSTCGCARADSLPGPPGAAWSGPPSAVRWITDAYASHGIPPHSPSSFVARARHGGSDRFERSASRLKPMPWISPSPQKRCPGPRHGVVDSIVDGRFASAASRLLQFWRSLVLQLP